MTKLKSVFHKWNEQQKIYYQPVLEALASHDITTDSVLFEKNLGVLCQTTGIARPRLRAFIKQVQFDTLLHEQPFSKDSQLFISTGFESLDQLLQHGFYFGQIIELCAETNAIPSRFTSHILASYLQSYSKQGIFIFDTTGMLEPRSMQETFIKKQLDPLILTQIETVQSFTLGDLSSSLENLAAILSTTESIHPLVVIDDLARLVGPDWSIAAVNSLIKMIQILTKKLNCCVIILHHISKKEISNSKAYDSMIDLRLFLAQQMESKQIDIQVLKSRQWVNT
ncbi:uncharacterized protein B0P05DRAFT_635189 [Gilbertella persicaria]|uniref:uncharacterized protein n=1 Tax=Gilbertella persicaria TaxID=101096 RepID=UPI002220877B|nr:uncharacterized protein B0P05DRAFT_635189 [Gilbertella persicaria]KAI8087971.1 hypothetical protein B0P05DRAFT_635189 [Gilbertella persicaria]